MKAETGDEKCEYEEWRGTVNALYFLTTQLESTVEVKADLCLRFIDYTKACNGVKHGEIIKLLENKTMMERIYN